MQYDRVDTAGDFNVLSDSQNLDIFENSYTMPVMLSCPLNKVQIMPYAMSSEVDYPGLYISALVAKSESKYFVNPDFKVGDFIYTDCREALTSLPAAMFADISPQHYENVNWKCVRTANSDFG